MTGEAETRQPVFLDADVLAAPMTRTVLILASLAGAGFVPRWSLLAETEADRALRPGQTRVSDLRTRFPWGTTVLIDPASKSAMEAMVDTSQTDRHILAAAYQAGLRTVVTRNVRDFGRSDLERLGMVAVHPDLFAATMLTTKTYQAMLTAMAASRLRPPNTPETIHAALSAEHPRLCSAMTELFPHAASVASHDSPPVEVFRGNRCLKCGKTLRNPIDLTQGICCEQSSR